MARIPERIVICILAAGESGRMGRSKQLLPWGETTLLGNAVGLARSVGVKKEVVLVLGAYASGIQASPDHQLDNVTVLINESWQDGMGKSISCAMKYVLRNETEPDGILFMTGDQPFLEKEDLERMIDVFCTGRYGIIAAKRKGGFGPPALFSSGYFDVLEQCKGQKGARKIISDHREDLHTLFYPTPRLTDIDTPEDYGHWYEKVFG